MRVAVVGAGASGLVTARSLRDEGIEPVVFERTDVPAGLWVYREDLPGGGGPAYRSLRTNTSRQVLGFSDFPFPDDLPDFPPRSAVVEYLERYADRFHLRETIRFQHEVRHVARDRSGGWSVCVSSSGGEERHHVDAVVVCSGIHPVPVIPPYPGLESWIGRAMHSMDYTSPESFRGEDVLVVGVGSSAADIAPEIASVARRVTLSARRGASILPRSLAGRPRDLRASRLARALPSSVSSWLVRRRVEEEMRRRGLPSPAGIWPDQPDAGRTITGDEMLAALATRTVRPVPPIERFEGADVVLANGERVRPDSIVFCTGYTRSFPPLGDLIQVASDSSIDLYKHVFHPDEPRLAFVGMCRVQGAVFPIIELQARWVARVLSGRAGLPSSAHMHTDIEAQRIRQPGALPMRVSLLDYGQELAKEIEASPRFWRHPRLLLPLLLGPPVAAQFRLDGPGRRADAARQVALSWSESRRRGGTGGSGTPRPRPHVTGS